LDARGDEPGDEAADVGAELMEGKGAVGVCGIYEKLYFSVSVV